MMQIIKDPDYDDYLVTVGDILIDCTNCRILKACASHPDQKDCYPSAKSPNRVRVDRWQWNLKGRQTMAQLHEERVKMGYVKRG